jgi:outer membrane protein OmpA-like peptidoglycan-associated protein
MMFKSRTRTIQSAWTASLVVGALGASAAIAQVNVKDALKDLPAWKIPEICVKDSAPSHCLSLESNAWRAVSGSWVSVPDAVKSKCLGTVKGPMDQSWRVLGDCVDEEMDRQADRKAVLTRRTPAEPVPPAKPVVVAQTAPAPPPPAPVATPTPPPAPAATPPATAPAVEGPVAVPPPVLGFQPAPPPFALDAEAEAKKAAASADATQKAEAERAAAAKAAAEKLAAEKAAAEAEERRKVEAAELARRAAAEAAEAKRKADMAAADAVKVAAAKVCQDQLQAIAKEGVVRFQVAKADLDNRSLPTLDKLAAAVKACPNTKIRVEGHTDSMGDPSANQSLSEDRAKVVAAYLVKAGVDAGRIGSAGFGPSKPIGDNATADGRAQNRRIEFGVDAN